MTNSVVGSISSDFLDVSGATTVFNPGTYNDMPATAGWHMMNINDFTYVQDFTKDTIAFLGAVTGMVGKQIINNKTYIDVEIPTKINSFIEYLNSYLFLNFLQNLSGIKEKLVPDPYLFGGGLHEIRRGGFLKIHSDFNVHPQLNLNRRLNLLLYLNKNWKEDW